jgi:hypothetical protein
VGDEHVEFLEGAFVEQQLDPFARGELALGVLRRDPALAAAQPGGRAARSSSCRIFMSVSSPPSCGSLSPRRTRREAFCGEFATSCELEFANLQSPAAHGPPASTPPRDGLRARHMPTWTTPGRRDTPLP